MDMQRIERLMQMELRLPKIRLSRRLWPAYLALIGLGAAGLAAKELRTHVDGQSHASLRMTADGALKQAEPYLRALQPDKARWTLSTESAHMRRMEFWNVSCSNEHGEEVADLVWSATRNHLVRIELYEAYSGTNDAPIVSPAEAIRSAEHWLNAFGFSPKTPHWHVKVTAHSLTRHWIVQADSRDESVTFGLDGSSGRLMHVLDTPRHVSHA